MTIKSLNDYLEKLSSARQDYIVLCVQKYSNRPYFHRGMLPFLSCQEAADCLKSHLEYMKAKQDTTDIDVAGKAMLGERLIKQTIDVFSHALLTRVADNEDYVVMHLNTKKMIRHYGKRFDKRFTINMSEWGWAGKRGLDGLYHLQMISRNTWKVTGPQVYMNVVTSILADNFSPL